MSRSYKKLPIFGIAGHPRRSSEKLDKRLANRYLRHWTKQELHEYGEEAALPILREASNVWNFNRDGKKYRRQLTDRHTSVVFVINPKHNFRHDDQRFHKTEKPKVMRK